MTMSEMVLVGSKMMNMFEVGTRVMVGMLIRELEGRMIKSRMIMSEMVLVRREMIEMVVRCEMRIRVMVGMTVRGEVGRMMIIVSKKTMSEIL